MEHIDPQCYDKPVLGQDGCVYEHYDGEWKKIHIFEGWKEYVKTQYDNYSDKKITLDEFVDSLTFVDFYKKASNYSGDMEHHYFGSFQYHSIYKMYLFLHILSYCEINIKEFIGENLSDFEANKNYEETLINKIKVCEYEYLIPTGKIIFGLHQRNIINNIKMFRFIEGPRNPDYYWGPCNIQELSKEHLEIFNTKLQEFQQDFKEKLKIFNLSQGEIDLIVTEFPGYVKHKINKDRDFSEPRIEYRDEIMWDDPDLIYNDPLTLHTFSVPCEALSENDRAEYFKNVYHSITQNLNEIAKINNVSDIIAYSMDHGIMWYNVPVIFETIYGKKIECIKKPHSGENKMILMIDNGYNIGAQIYIMIKTGIVKYVNNFYCPNT